MVGHFIEARVQFTSFVDHEAQHNDHFLSHATKILFARP